MHAVNLVQCTTALDVTELFIIGLCSTQVSVYQLLDASRGNNTQETKLLSSRLVPVHSAGWEVFTITQAVSTPSSERSPELCLDPVANSNVPFLR